jgi:endonuclease-3
MSTVAERQPVRGKRRAAEPSSPAGDGKKKAKSVRKPASSPREPVAPPAGWRRIYDLVFELRADRTAVVDSMGTEAVAAQSGPDRAYQALISLMLSSQTKDTVNAATMVKLRAHGLTMANILATPDAKLDELIHAVGFHNNKVRFIKRTTALLVEEHAGVVPDAMETLLALPGVGPKMALILLNVVFGKCEGISVDTHVHRISNQLGWAGRTPTKTPEHTRAALECWVPRDECLQRDSNSQSADPSGLLARRLTLRSRCRWPHVNLLLVGLGQEIQTERQKLLRKCLRCSDPRGALQLVTTLGLDVGKEMARGGLQLPPGVELGQLGGKKGRAALMVD